MYELNLSLNENVNKNKIEKSDLVGQVHTKVRVKSKFFNM